jgi:hypothetical protein
VLVASTELAEIAEVRDSFKERAKEDLINEITMHENYGNLFNGVVNSLRPKDLRNFEVPRRIARY